MAMSTQLPRTFACADLIDQLANDDPFTSPPPDAAANVSSHRTHITLPPPPPPGIWPPGNIDVDNLQEWTIREIEQYFASCGESLPETQSTEFTARWFPSRERINSLETRACPKLRLVCFSCAGNDDSMWTGEGSKMHPVPNPLLDYCRSQNIELLAVQLPGRMHRRHEQFVTSCREAALLCIRAFTGLANFASVPYAVCGHSVGSWIAFEFAVAAKQCGLTEPVQLIVSCFPWPHIPVCDRPWKISGTLAEEQLKMEVARWDVRPAVLSTHWQMFGRIIQADFALFDTYGPHTLTIDCPILAFCATADRMVSETFIRRWSDATSAECDVRTVHGHHLFPLEPSLVSARDEWMGEIAASLESAIAKPHRHP